MDININSDHMIVHDEWCVVHYELHSNPCKHTITSIHTMSLYNKYIYMKYEEVTYGGSGDIHVPGRELMHF
jgi:hypothetical protein